MDRRAQLAAWVVILLIGVGVGYVATVVRPFPEDESPWPLRARYEVARYPRGADAGEGSRTVHEFEGRGWGDWVDVSWDGEEPAEATVARFDGRTASGVVAEPEPDRPFATLALVDEASWQDVEAVHDQRRPPNDWFTFTFGQPPEPAVGRVIGGDDDWEWDAEAIAADLGLEADDLAAGQYWQPTCEELDIDACGRDVYRYRYVYLRDARVPVYVEEYKSVTGRTTLVTVTRMDLRLTEGTALVAG